jgi:hypothetical protein
MSDEKVTRIEVYRDKNTRKVLEELLARFDEGDVSGLIIGVRLGTTDHGIIVTGQYNADPGAGALVAGRMAKILSNRFDKMVKSGVLLKRKSATVHQLKKKDEK